MKDSNFYHHLYQAEGRDTMEAAAAAIEKAEYWGKPETCHDGMFEDAIRMATLRVNYALAVEIRQLRQAMACPPAQGDERGLTWQQ